MEVNYYDIRKIYKTEINKNVRNKKRIYNFEKKSEMYFLSMYDELKKGTYSGGKYSIFLVY